MSWFPDSLACNGVHLFPSWFLRNGGRNLGAEPTDLWPSTFDFKTFLEPECQPVTGVSPAPDSEPTSEAVATECPLLEWVVIAFGTVLQVLRDQDCVTRDFLLVVTPHVLDVVLPVEASTRFWLDFLRVIPFPHLVVGLTITLSTIWHKFWVKKHLF